MAPSTPDKLALVPLAEDEQLEALARTAEPEPGKAIRPSREDRTDDLLQAYIRDQASSNSVLTAAQERDLFQHLERQVQFTHSLRLKHPVALVYIERLYNKILPLTTEEAGRELSIFVEAGESRHIPHQLHGSRLAGFLEHASDHRVLCQQAIDSVQGLNSVREARSPAFPALKASYLHTLSQSAELIRELVLVPGHFIAISQCIETHLIEVRNGAHSWTDTTLGRIDPQLGLTVEELEKRFRTLRKAETELDRLRKAAIESNLRLVVNIALRYRNRGLELLDLIQEGNLGLMKAVDRFDHHLGHRFSTYAAHWIQQAIKKALLEKARPIRLPEGKVELLVTLSRTTAQLTQKLNRTPNVQELARELGMSPGVISHLLEVAASPLSLQRSHLTQHQGEVDLRDVIADQTTVYPWEVVDRRHLKDVLPDLLKVLSDKDRRIIELRHGIGTDDGEPMTLAEVARLVYKGVKVVHRRQIEAIRKRQASALKKLQHPARIKHLS